MIRVYDTETKQYLLFSDYLESLTNDDDYGKKRSVTAIAEHADGNAKFTCADHGFLTGQNIVIVDTDNYDGSYEVEVIDGDNFTVDVAYEEDELSGEAYPIMDSTYYLVFLYKISDIFNYVKTLTAIKARTIRDANGKMLTDEVSFTDDRQDIFDIFVKEAANKVFEKIQAYSKGIVNAYKFNEQIDFDADGTIGAGETDYYIHYAIDEDKDNQDENICSVLESKIEDALVLYVLKEWYETCSMLQEMQINEIKSNHALDQVKSLAMKAEGHKRVAFHDTII